MPGNDGGYHAHGDHYDRAGKIEKGNGGALVMAAPPGEPANSEGPSMYEMEGPSPRLGALASR